MATPYPGLEWIAYTTDGDTILVLADEEGTSGTVARIDPGTGEVLATIPDQISDFGTIPIPALEAGLIATVDSDGSAALYDLQTFEPIMALPENRYAAAVSRDGTRVFLNDFDGGPAVVAEVGSWEVLATVEDNFISTGFSPDGDLVAAYNGFTGYGWLIDIPSGSVFVSIGEGDLFPGRFSPDGSLFTVHTINGGLKLIDVAALRAGSDLDQAVIWEITAHNGPAPLSYFSSDGSLIVTVGAGDRRLRVWETLSGDLVADFGEFGGSFPMAYFHPDGVHLIAEDAGGTIQVLTLDSKELVDIATARMTRGFTEDECQLYGIDPCPTLDELKSGSA